MNMSEWVKIITFCCCCCKLALKSAKCNLTHTHACFQPCAFIRLNVASRLRLGSFFLPKSSTKKKCLHRRFVFVRRFSLSCWCCCSSSACANEQFDVIDPIGFGSSDFEFNDASYFLCYQMRCVRSQVGQRRRVPRPSAIQSGCSAASDSLDKLVDYLAWSICPRSSTSRRPSWNVND